MPIEKSMKLGILTRGSETKGSSRLRAFQYVKHLERIGIETRILSRPWQASWITRSQYVMEAISLAAWADVLLLQKPNQSIKLLDLLYKVNSRLIVDFDDAVWASPPIQSSSRAVQLAHKFEVRLQHAIRRAGFVITGSHYLADWVKRSFPDCDVTVIPTSVDLDNYKQLKESRSLGPLTIGWIGSPGNLVDLVQVAPVLTLLYERYGARLRVISSCRPSLGNLDFDFEPWTAEAERDALQRLDIGIMPLDDSERSRGRCGFKAIQYMATGLPVIASPVGGAREVIEDGNTGYYAATPKQWLSRCNELIESTALRTQMGINGRHRVEKLYSVQNNLPVLLNILERRLAC